jgi:hypothetical protein
MPSHHSKQVVTQPPVDPGSIPDNTESWDDKFTLSESRLKEWMFGPHERQRQPIYDAIKRLKEQGIDDRIIGRLLYYDESTMERRYIQVLKLVTNKAGKFWTCEALQISGQSSEAEIESIRTEHNGRWLPYYYISQISRIYDNRTNPPRHYITCSWLFEGLRVGNVEGVIN